MKTPAVAQTAPKQIQRLVALPAHGIIHGNPKSKKSRRVVTLPDEAVAVLKHQKALQAEFRLKAGPKWVTSEFVFTNRLGEWLRPSAVSKHWALIRTKAGVGNLKLHGLRHTHATMLLKAGLHPKVVMERLGHSTITMGMDLYAHVIGSLQNEATDKLNGMMPKATKPQNECRIYIWIYTS